MAPKLVLVLVSLSFFVGFGAAKSSPSPPPVSPLPSVFATGTPYAVGVATGMTFAKHINEYMAVSELWNKELLPFYDTNEGKYVVANFTATNCAHFPDICDEIKGLADGSGNTFEHMMLLNLQEDLRLLTSQSTKSLRGGTATTASKYSKGCSDIHVVSDGALLLGHNEDADDELRNRTYLIQGHYMGGANQEQDLRITSYNYAGVLPNAFGFNSHGIIMSINTLYPNDVKVGGLATWFITRDILNAKSIDDAIARASVKGAANGFSLNLGSTRERRMLNVEVSSSGITVHEDHSDYFHFNMYLHSPDVSQNPSASSIHRRARVMEIEKERGMPRNAKDILAILGDTKDGSYPIYRHATPVDDSTTLATAIFDLFGKSLNIYTTNSLDTDIVAASLPLF